VDEYRGFQRLPKPLFKKARMEAGDGIGLRLSRLQVQNTTFHRVIKTTRHVSKTTPKPQSGVRFGVRWGHDHPLRWRYPEIIERSFNTAVKRRVWLKSFKSFTEILIGVNSLFKWGDVSKTAFSVKS
jgi:hypothetical protein